jgi:ubiquinone/menaquinone biosynthesis C-methylase UbiE
MFHLHDEATRRKWQDPEAILAEIGVKPGYTFADIGCGDGFFTLPAARLVGEKGTVYGLDINPDFIASIREKAEKEGLANIHLVVGKGEDVVLCEACADVVFFGIVLHDFSAPAKVLANAAKMLKPDGILANLDWKKEPMSMGPPVHIRFSQQDATRIIEGAGFHVQSVKDSGLYHYLVIANINPR